MQKLVWSVAAVGALLCTLPASAEDAYRPVCVSKGHNAMVTLVLCPEGLSAADYAMEGKAICQDEKPCGAWFWTDAAVVPAEAPPSHDLLPQASVQAAHAVWMNERDQLVVIEQSAEQ